MLCFYVNCFFASVSLIYNRECGSSQKLRDSFLWQEINQHTNRLYYAFSNYRFGGVMGRAKILADNNHMTLEGNLIDDGALRSSSSLSVAVFQKKPDNPTVIIPEDFG